MSCRSNNTNCSPASAHKDHETVAFVSHHAHIVAQPRKMTFDLLAQILLVIEFPLRHATSAEQPFHTLRIEKAAELARLRLAMQASGTTATHALAAQQQIGKRAHSAHIPDRYNVKQTPRRHQT